MVNFSINEKEANIIIFNSLSERYAGLKACPEIRDEEMFKKIEYLKNVYEKKIELDNLKR